MRNLHKLYYKDYFSEVDFTDLDSNKSQKAVLESNRILTQIVSKADLPDEKIGEDMMGFELQVQYPGLITGVGIQHEASVKGEFKLGLHLDYTTGLPVVYGSSVKGVLRSYFAEKYSGDADVQRLVADVFEGKSYSEQGCNKSVYCRDVFYDAVVVSPNSDGQILVSDALAPHGTSDPNYPFIDPTPIQFVKIASGTVLKFRFKLVPTKDGDTVVMSADNKLELFKEILTTFGIGAKTNVGYGQFELSDEDRHKKGKQLLLLAQTYQTNQEYKSAEKFLGEARELLKANSEEYRMCLEQIKELKLLPFYQYLASGDNFLQSNDFDAAEQEFEKAKGYAEEMGIFTDDVIISEYDTKKSTLHAHRLQSQVVISVLPDSYSEHISKAKDMKTLIDKTKKWLKEGRIVDIVARDAKVAELRSKIKDKMLPNFEKQMSQLQDLK